MFAYDVIYKVALDYLLKIEIDKIWNSEQYEHLRLGHLFLRSEKEEVLTECQCLRKRGSYGDWESLVAEGMTGFSGALTKESWNVNGDNRGEPIRRSG